MRGGIHSKPGAGGGRAPIPAGRGKELGGWYGSGARGVSKSELLLLDRDRDRERDTERVEDLERERERDCLLLEAPALSLRLCCFRLFGLDFFSPGPDAIDTVSLSDRLSQPEDEDESMSRTSMGKEPGLVISDFRSLGASRTDMLQGVTAKPLV